MIIDVPTRVDFENSGVDFLALAWDFTSKLALEMDEFDIDWDDPEPDATQYRSAAQKPLATALALAQQGEKRPDFATYRVLCSHASRTPHPRHFAGGCRTWMISATCQHTARILSAMSRTHARSSLVLRTISRLPSPVTMTP